VLAEAFPVVGGENDEGVVQGPFGPEPLEHPADPAIGLRHLGVVRSRRERGEIRRSELVRLVRIEEMDPHEERLPAAIRLPSAEPCEGSIRGARRGTLADHEQRRLVLRPEVVVVQVESLIETVAPCEDER